jgi:hypothetical protein
VDADGGNVEFAARGALVQSLDVLQNVLKMKTVRGNQIFRERIKHEGVVRVGRMTKSQSRFFHPRKLNHAARAVTTRSLMKGKFGITLGYTHAPDKSG